MNTRTVAVLASSLLAIIGFFVSCTESYAATGWWNVGGIPGVTTVEPYNESKNRSFAVSST